MRLTKPRPHPNVLIGIPVYNEARYVAKVLAEVRRYHDDILVIDDANFQKFVDDDSSYQSWIAAWPGGYVLNCNRSPNSAYLILHRAACTSITELQAGMQTFTGEYVKVCSTDRGAITQWAIDSTGAAPTRRCR